MHEIESYAAHVAAKFKPAICCVYALGFRDTACLKNTEEKYKGHLSPKTNKQVRY